MSCNKYSELISLYVDNELDKEQIKEVVQHISECGECKKEYEELLELKKSLSTLVKESDRSLSLEVMKRINKKKTPFIFRHIGLTASLVFIVVLAVFTYTHKEDAPVNNFKAEESTVSIKNSMDTAVLESTEISNGVSFDYCMSEPEEVIQEVLAESVVASPAPENSAMHTEITVEAELEDVIDKIKEHYLSYTVDNNVITVEVSLSELLQVLDFTPTKTVGNGQGYVKIIVE